MANLRTNFSNWYHFVFYELQDVRTRDWFPSVHILAVILLTYIYFCKSLGPRLMQDKRPFVLKNTIMLYNIFQIIISAYLVYGGFKYGWSRWNWSCQPVDYSDSAETANYHNIVWGYTVLKVIDLLDTVFFVLRKKDRQISALHLYHHFMMPICAYVGIKYYPNGHATLLGIINSFVHIIMYTYYLLAGLGPKFQKFLWWKRYVTLLQLTQFFFLLCHNISAIVVDCAYPRWITVTLSFCCCHFVYMFGSFYYENYIKTKNISNGSGHIINKQKKI